MDFLLDNEILANWLIQYGSIFLFVLLVLGIIILPVPEETLMVLAGILMSKGNLNIPFTILAAYAGSICGITISYMLGRTGGNYLIHKYGSWIGITEKQLVKVHNWFDRFGKWTLLIGYFIPGLRHFTGFASGMTCLEFKQFALFAYSGAIIWVTTFLSVGYFFGNYCFSIFENVEIGIEEIVLFIIFMLVLSILFLKFRTSSFFKSK